MDIIKKTNELEVHIEEKVIKLKGHQDRDVFSLYTESVETYPFSSKKEKTLILEKIKNRLDIVLR